MNYLDRLSFQLYSARKFPPIADQLATLAKLGYRNVEPFGALFDDAETLKSAIDRNRLAVPSCHIGIELMRRDPDAAIAIARRFGVAIVVIPYLQPPDRPKDTASWTAFARELQGFATRLKASGLKVAWHNHDFEMIPLADGKVPMDIILTTAPDLQWEIDIGWIVRAGADPLTWLQRYKNRVSAVHLKDVAGKGKATDEDGWADVGHGEIDWQRLMPALSATNADVLIVEHDNPSDFERFARRSRETVATW